MKEKFKLIIFPYIITSLSYFLICSLIYWIQNKYLEIDDKYFGFWFPTICSGIITWFYLRKKIKRLIISENHQSFILFLSWILLTASVVTFSFYLNRENGKITYLNHPDEIFTQPITMYYSIQSTKIEKKLSGFSVSRSYVNRGNEIAVSCYYISPLINENKDFDQSNKLWIGLLVGENFSNRVLDDKQKQEKLIKNFIDSSYINFSKHKFQTRFLKKVPIGEDEDYKRGIENLGLSIQNSIILREETGNYIERTGSSFTWAIALLLISNLTWFLMTIFEKMRKKIQETFY